MRFSYVSKFFCKLATSKTCYIVWWTHQPWHTSCCDPPWAHHLWRLNGRLILLPYEPQNVGQVQRIQWVQYNSITCGAQKLKVTWSDMPGIFGVDSSVSPVAELKMQRSRILAAGDCEEDRLVHSTTLVAEIRVQAVETSPCSGAENKFQKNIQRPKYELALSCHVFTVAVSTYKRWL